MLRFRTLSPQALHPELCCRLRARDANQRAAVCQEGKHRSCSRTRLIQTHFLPGHTQHKTMSGFKSDPKWLSVERDMYVTLGFQAIFRDVEAFLWKRQSNQLRVKCNKIRIWLANVTVCSLFANRGFKDTYLPIYLPILTKQHLKLMQMFSGNNKEAARVQK